MHLIFFKMHQMLSKCVYCFKIHVIFFKARLICFTIFSNIFIDHQNDYFKSKSQKKGGQCKSKNYTILSSLFSIISSMVFHKNIKFLKIFVTTLKIVIIFMTNLVGVFEMAYFYQSKSYTILNIFKHKVSSRAFLNFFSKF